MQLLVVSLQKSGTSEIELRHALVNVINETRTAYKVERHPACDGRTYVRKSEIEKVIVVSEGVSVSATIYALSESKTLSPEVFHYWKKRAKDGLLEFLEHQHRRLKVIHDEVLKKC